MDATNLKTPVEPENIQVRPTNQIKFERMRIFH